MDNSYDIILDKLEKIEQKISKIEETINKIEPNTARMENHINFVETVYDNVKSPFHLLMNKINILSYLPSSEKNLK